MFLSNLPSRAVPCIGPLTVLPMDAAVSLRSIRVDTGSTDEQSSTAATRSQRYPRQRHAGRAWRSRQHRDVSDDDLTVGGHLVVRKQVAIELAGNANRRGRIPEVDDDEQTGGVAAGRPVVRFRR